VSANGRYTVTKDLPGGRALDPDTDMMKGVAAPFKFGWTIQGAYDSVAFENVDVTEQTRSGGGTVDGFDYTVQISEYNQGGLKDIRLLVQSSAAGLTDQAHLSFADIMVTDSTATTEELTASITSFSVRNPDDPTDATDPLPINSGASFALQWETEKAVVAKCNHGGLGGAQDLAIEPAGGGTTAVQAAGAPGVYTLTFSAQGSDGKWVTATARVKVIENRPTIDVFGARPSVPDGKSHPIDNLQVPQGSAVTLYWTARNVAQLYLSDGSGLKKVDETARSGTFEIYLGTTDQSWMLLAGEKDSSLHDPDSGWVKSGAVDIHLHDADDTVSPIAVVDPHLDPSHSGDESSDEDKDKQDDKEKEEEGGLGAGIAINKFEIPLGGIEIGVGNYGKLTISGALTVENGAVEKEGSTQVAINPSEVAIEISREMGRFSVGGNEIKWEISGELSAEEISFSAFKASISSKAYPAVTSELAIGGTVWKKPEHGHGAEVLALTGSGSVSASLAGYKVAGGKLLGGSVEGTIEVSFQPNWAFITGKIAGKVAGKLVEVSFEIEEAALGGFAVSMIILLIEGLVDFVGLMDDFGKATPRIQEANRAFGAAFLNSVRTGGAEQHGANESEYFTRAEANEGARAGARFIEGLYNKYKALPQVKDWLQTNSDDPDKDAQVEKAFYDWKQAHLPMLERACSKAESAHYGQTCAAYIREFVKSHGNDTVLAGSLVRSYYQPSGNQRGHGYYTLAQQQRGSPPGDILAYLKTFGPPHRPFIEGIGDVIEGKDLDDVIKHGYDGAAFVKE
jgi:hypothetical protein